MVDGEEGESPSNSLKSHSTSVTTPDQSQGDDGDIWASDDDLVPGEGSTGDRNPPEVLSDLPTIRRQHMTDGYREGLSVGKARVMQQGFDDGYPIGMQIGLRAGKVLGVLEGIAESKGVSDVPDRKVAVQKLYDQAKAELSIVQMLKETNDQIIAEAKDVPDSVLLVLQKWETAILGSVSDQGTSPEK